VQPSFYGTDNSALLDGLDRLGTLGRGVAVVDPAVMPRETLADFHRRGVRG
jgi:2-pyrone-4,6-dicarboxylate lactonase